MLNRPLKVGLPTRKFAPLIITTPLIITNHVSPRQRQLPLLVVFEVVSFTKASWVFSRPPPPYHILALCQIPRLREVGQNDQTAACLGLAQQLYIFFHVAERSVIQCYFHVQQDILQFSPGESSFSNAFVERLLDKPNHSLKLPNAPWCFGEFEVPLDVQLGKETCAVMFILHHILHPLCCTHKCSTIIQVTLLWAAFPYDESLQGTDKLFCLHDFCQFEVQGTVQAANMQDYVGFPLSVSANTVLYWTCIVNPDDLKGHSSHSMILRQVSWRGVGVCNSMKPLAFIAALNQTFDELVQSGDPMCLSHFGHG